MKIPFDFSIDDWIDRFRQLFEIVANFLKEGFGLDLFSEEDHAGSDTL